DQPKKTPLFIREDFESAAAEGRLVPKGWKGSGLRVSKTGPKAFLEVSEQNGTHSAELETPLDGDFVIECGCVFPSGGELGFIFMGKDKENDVGGQFTGEVMIGAKRYARPNLTEPIGKVTIKRTGDELKVYFNENTAAAAGQQLPEVIKIQSLRISLTK